MTKYLATLIRYNNVTTPEHRTAVLVYSDPDGDTYCETGFQDMDGLNADIAEKTFPAAKAGR